MKRAIFNRGGSAHRAGGEVELDHGVIPACATVTPQASGPAVFTARTDCELMLLGGEPLGHRFLEWNFVSSSRDRIEQAKADWRAGRMKLPDADHDKFIPLPGDPPPAANPMS